MTALDHKFKHICKDAFDIETETSDCKAYEHKLVELLNLCCNNLDCEEVLSELFIEVAKGEIEAPQGTVGFCMRQLKLVKVLEFILNEKSIETKNYRYNLGEYHSTIDAYESDTWEDADLWNYYSN